MDAQQQRVYDHLVRNGWDATDAKNLAVHGRNTLTFAAANLNGAVRELWQTILATVRR